MAGPSIFLKVFSFGESCELDILQMNVKEYCLRMSDPEPHAFLDIL